MVKIVEELEFLLPFFPGTSDPIVFPDGAGKQFNF